MFGELVKIVGLLGSAVSGVRKLKTEAERKEAVLGLLKTYFLLKDCVDDGEQLVLEAGPNPVEKISSQIAEEALATLTRWDSVIRRQGIRLYELQGYIFAEDHLIVIDPDLQDKLSDAIGRKMERAVSLHGIGAALYFKNLFPVADTNEEQARYVSIMAGAEDDLLDMDQISAEISMLREALSQYRGVIDRMATDSELLVLSKTARQATAVRDATQEA